VGVNQAEAVRSQHLDAVLFDCREELLFASKSLATDFLEAGSNRYHVGGPGLTHLTGQGRYDLGRHTHNSHVSNFWELRDTAIDIVAEDLVFVRIDWVDVPREIAFLEVTHHCVTDLSLRVGCANDCNGIWSE